jgi:hypothetical protein
LRRVFRTILLTLLGSIAWPASHRWANANEYNLAMQALQERDLIQQFALLNDWQTRYPNSDFANLRTFAAAKNLERQGKLEDSFTRAAELLQSQPPDSAALWLIVEIGPKLTPSGKVATAVQDAALKLKSMERSAACSLDEMTQASSSSVPPVTRTGVWTLTSAKFAFRIKFASKETRPP